MTELRERQNDILSIIRGLDISPTMFHNAVKKYHALADFLVSRGIEADMYPQGSFALGTVVRPTTEDPDAAYDLDFICQVRQVRGQIAPSELRKKVEDALRSDERYASRLKLQDECFTIEYADVGEVGFTIDVVPAVDESLEYKLELAQMSDNVDLLNTAIAIPAYNGGRNYDWITNNPRGLRTWFEGVNLPFAEFDLENRRNRMFARNRQTFASVEEIPDELMRSALQRVIQILKHHRNIYYLGLSQHQKDDLKPSSAAISVIAAEILKNADPNLGVFELLRLALDELNIYAERRTLNDIEFGKKFGLRSVIARSGEGEKWIVKNPANPGDNLVDKWNDDVRIPDCFFRWVKVCRRDLVDSLELSDHEFRTTVENAFGLNVVKKYWNDKYNTTPGDKPRMFMVSPKPFLR